MRAYRLLLRLYPASFRREYGGEMSALFAARRRDVHGLGVAGFWIGTVFEVLGNALLVHWDILRQDLRHSLRVLTRAPGFALTAIVVTALGIGANTAAFSVADFVFLRPLPFANAERIVALWEHPPGYATNQPSPANYRDWRTMTTSFEGMGAYHEKPVNLLGAAEPLRVDGIAATGDLFAILGVRPFLGRPFSVAELREGTHVVLLSYAIWRDHFAAMPGVIGRTLNLDGKAYVVIGVMPKTFVFPDRHTAIWTTMEPSEMADPDRTNNWFNVFARLRPGVTIERASADLNRVARRLAIQYPKEQGKTGGAVMGLREVYSALYNTGQARVLLLALCGAALCVLLIACANLANLLLARSLGRQREFAVRAALGAGRERLARQLATEHLLLAGAGGMLGVAFAIICVPVLARLVPEASPLAQVPALDLRVLAVAAALTVLTGIGFGVIPAFRVGRGRSVEGLRSDTRAGGGRAGRLRAALVVGEMVGSVVLLVTAGLLIRAMLRVQRIDPGFRAAQVTTLRTALPGYRYDLTSARVRFYDAVLAGVRALPGVQQAGYISALPIVWGGGIWPVGGAGQSLERASDKTAMLRFITPGYLSTLGIPLVRGRDISAADAPGGPSVAVVSESFAQRYWPTGDPVGQHFGFAFHDRVVVGVVHDVRARGLERTAEPQVYLSYKQVPDSELTYYAPKDLAIRTMLPLAALVPAVRHVVHRIDPEVPISDVRTLTEIVDGQTASRSVQVRILGAFAVVALLLASVGIHGLLAYTVSQRSREIGIRLALGAGRRSIVALVMRQAIVLTLAGLIPGVVLAYGAGRGLGAVLAGVRPTDGATFGAAVTVCAGMTLIGSLVPVLRAVRVDPNSVMRAE